jgi:hypothetical protein
VSITTLGIPITGNPGMPIGYGKTKEDAIQDLKIQIEDHENNI